jgi:3-carboxy-cis,cis-muconate cycloisomerase
MSDLLWPGDHRAGSLLSDVSVLDALVRVETAWLEALVAAGVAPPAARGDLATLVSGDDLAEVAVGAEAGGNPVIPLVELLRARAGGPHPETAAWLHRGLTSQDVLDSALMMACRPAVLRVQEELRQQVGRLSRLAAEHRSTPMVGRTLTQHAVPTTFGLKVSTWLSGVLDAHDALTAVALPVQVGGAAGTLAAVVELAGSTADPLRTTRDLTAAFARAVGLAEAAPWHTTRTPVTRLGDAATSCTDAWGHLARDVLLLTRPEIGELGVADGGGSSTMPGKQNPTAAVLVRRASLAAPHLAATLHVAAADSVDERSDGAWHTEWATLRTLLRRTVVAAEQTSALLQHLRVHPDSMAARLEAAGGVRSEQRAMADLRGVEPTGDYLGAAAALVDTVLDRADRALGRAGR